MKILKTWWHGKHVPPTFESLWGGRTPDGHFRRPVVARISIAISKFCSNHWQWLIPTAISLAALTGWLSLKMTASEERQKVATVLIPEVQFNERRAKAFASVHEQMASGKPLKDEHGKPVQLDLSQAGILPGSFSFSTFDATLQGQSHLDRDLIDALHSFYRLLRQAERFREAAATDRAPPRRARFLQDYFSSAADAAKVAREKELMRRLEITAK